jgi:hypothetical protein
VALREGRIGAYLALGITIFAAGTTVAWMIWQLIDALRHG